MGSPQVLAQFAPQVNAGDEERVFSDVYTPALQAALRTAWMEVQAPEDFPEGYFPIGLP